MQTRFDGMNKPEHRRASSIIIVIIILIIIIIIIIIVIAKLKPLSLFISLF